MKTFLRKGVLFYCSPPPPPCASMFYFLNFDQKTIFCQSCFFNIRFSLTILFFCSKSQKHVGVILLNLFAEKQFIFLQLQLNWKYRSRGHWCFPKIFLYGEGGKIIRGMFLFCILLYYTSKYLKIFLESCSIPPTLCVSLNYRLHRRFMKKWKL